MRSDLLIDPINTVFAVNCKVEGDALHCGALYLDPLVQRHYIRLSDKSASVVVEIPIEMVNQPAPFRAWDVTLPLHNDK
jgi:hypothetical protein